MSSNRKRWSFHPQAKFRLGAKVETFEYKIGSAFSTHPFKVRAKFLNIFLGYRYLSIPLSRSEPTIL